jgi:hypothetical protein
MTEFKETVELLTWGFLAGYLWHPIWAIIKKIVSEAKKTKEKW